MERFIFFVFVHRRFQSVVVRMTHLLDITFILLFFTM
jgi:hypothetical protein